MKSIPYNLYMKILICLQSTAQVSSTVDLAYQQGRIFVQGHILVALKRNVP